MKDRDKETIKGPRWEGNVFFNSSLIGAFLDFEIEWDCIIKGTYGAVWFLKSKHTGRRQCAVKTLDPEKFDSAEFKSDKDIFCREVMKSLEIPKVINVLNYVGFKMVGAFHRDEEVFYIPVLRMEAMDGSLEGWINNNEFGIEDRLIALAQAFNGLIHLYSYGFEGHGDLKPSNLLYVDASVSQDFGDSKVPFPSDKHSLIVKVADLGWADAWVDLGFKDKAFRQYLAPERIDDEAFFVPKKSDVFSMGIIMAELLQGFHPAPNVKKRSDSRSNWRKWCKKGERDLSKIESTRIKGLIEKCLDEIPENRPSPEECMSELCLELKDKYWGGYDVEETLKLWNVVPINKETDPEYVLRQEINSLTHISINNIEALGSKYVLDYCLKLEGLIDKLTVNSLDTCDDWVTVTSCLKYYYQKESTVYNGLCFKGKMREFRETGKRYLETIIYKIDLDQLNKLPPSLGRWIHDWRPFERLFNSIGKMANFLDLQYKDIDFREVDCGNLARAAFAVTSAIDLGTYKVDDKLVNSYFADAVKFAPDIADVYLHRYLNSENRHFDSESQDGKYKPAPEPDPCLRASWIKDLEKACELDPEWFEPESRLKNLLERTSQSG